MKHTKMGLTSVVTTIVLAILFNVLAPSGDVYSDLALMVNTLRFNLGDSILVTGCRVCYGKDSHDVYSIVNRSCQQCLTTQPYTPMCSEYSKVLNIYHEFQNSNVCKKEKWRWFFDNVAYEFNSDYGECQVTDACCLENTKNKSVKSYFPNLNRKILVENTHRVHYSIHSGLVYNIDLLIGGGDGTTCYEMLANLDASQIDSLVNTNVTLEEIQLKERVFTMKELANHEIRLRMEFDVNDHCGIYLRLHDPMQYTQEIKTCGDHSCLLHLKLLHRYTVIHDLKTWKFQTEFMHGNIKVGGDTCNLLQIYGWTILIPILFNLSFNIVIFVKDLKTGKAGAYEIIPLLCLFYPQWKILKLLCNYAFGHRNEDQLGTDTKEFDRDVSSLEPFLESAFQVRILHVWPCQNVDNQNTLYIPYS